ncbi:MAG TPA: protein kinase [Actinomycetes bacterium]
MKPETDALLGTRYRLTGRIAGGGMGEVWRATDEVLGRDVAVKILRPEYADDPTFLERFRAEARHTARLSHPGIAAVYDYGEDAGSPYLVMEHVDGEPLSALISREGPLQPERTLDLVGQAALGLEAAHENGVVHRDVKPGNLLVMPDGTVKITDFGIARAANSVPLTQTGAIMGTAYYISPEQASGGSVTPASDIYSLGVVAYECLSGQRPFRGDTPVSVALAQVRDEPPALPAGVPAPVRALVMRMLAKEPGERPADAGRLGREALALSTSLAVAAPAAGGVDATRTMPAVQAPEATQVVDPVEAGAGGGTDTDPGFVLPARRSRGWLAAAAVAGLVLLMLLGAWLRASLTGADPGHAAVPPASSAPATSTTPEGVTVVAADYLGRPADEVRAELEDAGLRVGMAYDTGEGAIGTVVAVSPDGTLSPGTQVTLTVVKAAQSDGGKGRGKHGKGKGD